MEADLSSSMPVAVVEWGTTEEQKVLVATLGTIVEEATANNVKPPAVIVVGKVVDLGSKLAWFKTASH
jgi:siroheme synthase